MVDQGVSGDLARDAGRSGSASRCETCDHGQTGRKEESVVSQVRNIMETFAQTSKEKVREWLQHRRLDNAPLPDIEQIRRDLGWQSSDPVPQAKEISSHGYIGSAFFSFS